MRDISVRYRGSFLGPLWLVVYPLLMLTVYSFVFAGIYGARWAGTASVEGYAVKLFAGLIVFHFFTDSLSRSASLIRGHTSYVKRMVFPLQILPLIPVLSALVSALISFGLLLAYLLARGYAVTYHLLFVFAVFAAFLILVAGLSWLISGLGVFFPDLAQVTPILLSVLLFLSPVFYPLASVPTGYVALVGASPLSFPIEAIRYLIFEGSFPSVFAFTIYVVVAVIVAIAGYSVFSSLRYKFSDVM